MALKFIFTLFLLSGSTSLSFADSIQQIIPEHSIVKVLPSQPIQGARLLYWDQSTADAMKLDLPPGRVGSPDFERAVLKLMAIEIKEGATAIPPNEVTSAYGEDHSPLLFVENDAMGGSGRAGFIQVAPGIFVNIKGIGQTGMHGEQPGPPSKDFKSHRDGSATLEEAIKETIYGRMADAETIAGGSRVIAIISTPRTIKYDDGNEVPLAIIVRTPVQRYDETVRRKTTDEDAILESIAQANAMRILKGDFVNDSNMGGEGEFVDYGCITHIGDYNLARSSQGVTLFSEATRLSAQGWFQAPGDYTGKIGKYLLNQMGLPQSTIADSRKVKEMGVSFIKLVRQKKGSLVDFAPLTTEQMNEGFNLHGWMADLAPNYFANPNLSEKEFIDQEWGRALSQQYLVLSQEKTYSNNGRKFLSSLYRSFQDVTVPSGMGQNVFAEKIRQLSRFKNRDINDLVRPQLFQKAGDLAREFGHSQDVQKIQYVIDEIVYSNRLGTNAGIEDNMVIRADDENTEVSIRAFRAEDGSLKLYQYPELPGAHAGEKFHFRLSTDQWKSYQDLEAVPVQTVHGEYLRVKIPHGAMAVTEDRVDFTPYVKDDAGKITWLRDNFHLKGPPLLLNERLGLATNFTRRNGYYHIQTALADDHHDLQIMVGDLSCNTGLHAQ